MLSHSVALRVRYKDTDQMKVVYYSNYFVWFEVARAELFREAGFVYKMIEEDMGLSLMVVEAECRYMSPARYDDLVNIYCRLKDIGNTSLTFEYDVKRGEDILAEGKTVHVFCDASGKGPKRMPKALKEALVK